MNRALYLVLARPKRIRLQIRKTEAVIEGLRLSMLPGSVRYDKDRVQSSPDDPMTQYITRIEKLEKKIQELQLKYLDAQDEIVLLADSLPGPQDTIITLRFVSGWDFPGIAKSLGMSERQMFRYYRKAIDALEKDVSECQ